MQFQIVTVTLCIVATKLRLFVHKPYDACFRYSHTSSGCKENYMHEPLVFSVPAGFS